MAKKNQENPLEGLERAYAHWQDLYENGGLDPFHADGENLNLVRNHIIYYKHQIEETCPLYTADALYQRDLPPEVCQDYMARFDEIRTAAEKSLKIYQADPNYQYLLRQQDMLTPRQRKDTMIDNVLGYVRGLEIAMWEDDLVSMRRHRKPDGYLESFRGCAERVRAALETDEPSLLAMDAKEESIADEIGMTM